MPRIQVKRMGLVFFLVVHLSWGSFAQSGIITTSVGNGIPGFSGDGGPATSAELNLPSGVAIDSAGNLYIADQNNYCIRKVTGAGVAELYFPQVPVGGGYST